MSSMVKVTFHKQMSDENRAEIEKYLFPYLWLVPAWCHELFVDLHRYEDDSAISTAIQYDYRTASMSFNAGWLLERPEHKQEMVIHDLLHISTSVYVDYAHGTFKRLCPEDEAKKFNEHILEESRMRCESMVQDLAHSIMNMPKL